MYHKILMAVLWWIDNNINHLIVENIAYKIDPDCNGWVVKACWNFCQWVGRMSMKYEE